MNIQEAVKKAVEENAVICRERALLRPDDVNGYIKPTNSYDTCLLIIRSGGKTTGGSRCWNPTADDLMADNWMVKKLGNELRDEISNV